MPPHPVNADFEVEECLYNYLDSKTSNGGGGGLNTFMKFPNCRLHRKLFRRAALGGPT